MFSSSWTQRLICLSVGLILRALRKLRKDVGLIILIALAWTTSQFWYLGLMDLYLQPMIILSVLPRIVLQISSMILNTEPESFTCGSLDAGWLTAIKHYRGSEHFILEILIGENPPHSSQSRLTYKVKWKSFFFYLGILAASCTPISTILGCFLAL